MGLRAFLMVNVADEMKQADLMKAIRELEETPGVDFVDPVIGSKDMVIMVDAPTAVDTVAKQITSKPWVKSSEVLRIVSMYERHRTSKDELFANLTPATV